MFSSMRSLKQWTTSISFCEVLVCMCMQNSLKIHRYIFRYGKKLMANLNEKHLKNNCIKVFQGNKKIQFILMQSRYIAATNFAK